MFWHWLMYGMLAANAIFVGRKAILRIQDGSDRVTDGVRKESEEWCWQDGSGVPYVVFFMVASPILTAFHIAKFLMFPRGVKSNYAKEKERQAAVEEAERLQRELLARMPALEAQVRSWQPGGFISAADALQEDLDRIEGDTTKAIGYTDLRAWDMAADDFDRAAAIITANAGQPWVQPPTKAKAKKAKS